MQESVRAVPSHRQLLLPDHRRAAAARRHPRQSLHLHRTARLRRLRHVRQTGAVQCWIEPLKIGIMTYKIIQMK